MYELRDYQSDAVALTHQRLTEGHRPILCAPTGSGKSVIAAHLANQFMQQERRVLFMSGRREILRDVYGIFCEVAGIANVGFLMAGEGPWWSYPPITVASWDTLKSRWDRSDIWHVPADVLLVDECHLALSDKMSRTILPYYQDKTVIGLTATPARQSGKGLGSYFSRIIQVRTVQQLIDSGHLAAPEYWAGKYADVSKVRTVNGDFEQKGLSAATNNVQLVGDVVDNFLRLARDRHTIVFGVDIAHAQALTERFQSAGVDAQVVHSRMDQGTRSLLTKQFKERKFQVLVNVGIATYGYDAPSVNCVVLARPTKSIVLHLQMIGRGMRPKPDGGYCMVLDHADNVRRLGRAQDLIRWRLDAGKVAAVNVTRTPATKDKPAESELTECAECHHLFGKSRTCPKCGWQKPTPSRDIAVVQADLVKIANSQSDTKFAATDERAWFRMMKGYRIANHRKPGLEFFAFEDKFGKKAPAEWWSLEPLEPSDRVSNFMLYRRISFAKSRARQSGPRAA